MFVTSENGFLQKIAKKGRYTELPLFSRLRDISRHRVTRGCLVYVLIRFGDFFTKKSISQLPSVARGPKIYLEIADNLPDKSRCKSSHIGDHSNVV